MKKHRMIRSILLLLVISFVLFFATVVFFFPGPIVFVINNKDFEITSYRSIPKSVHENNGSWWGYNQSKLAIIDDTIFSFDYDNANFENGNPSLSNPYQCVFHKTEQGVTEIFGFADTERPCNVVADATHNLVYYFAVEPVGINIGNNGNTGIAKTMMYVYQFHPNTKEISLQRSVEVDPPSSIGKIRQSVTVDHFGNIAIAYGEYSGMMTVLTYHSLEDRWEKHQTLSNPDQDSLMYCYIELVDLNHFYTLCVQDTSRDNTTYYQYVKLFEFKNDVWADFMIVDYRNLPEAQEESQLVEHTELKRIDDEVHIITRSNPLKEIKHFVYKNGVIEEMPNKLKGRHDWIRLAEINDKLYYFSMRNTLIATLDITEVSTGKRVFQTIGMAMGSYFYLGDEMEGGEIPMLFYPGWGDMLYKQSDAMQILIRSKSTS